MILLELEFLSQNLIVKQDSPASAMAEFLALSRHRAIATCAAAALRNLHTGAAAQLARDQLLAEPGLLAGRRTRTLVENIQARAAND